MYCIKVGLLHEGQPLFSNAAEIELEDLTLIVTNGVHHKKRELLLFLFFWGRSDLERYLWVTSLNKKLCRCEIKKRSTLLVSFEHCWKLPSYSLTCWKWFKAVCLWEVIFDVRTRTSAILAETAYAERYYLSAISFHKKNAATKRDAEFRSRLLLRWATCFDGITEKFAQAPQWKLDFRRKSVYMVGKTN